MKKLLSKLLCLTLCTALCLGVCVFASADAKTKVKDALETVKLKDLYEIGKETVTIRVPAGWKTYIDKPSVLETLADGEVSNGILAKSYLPVEGAVKKDAEDVKLYAYDDESMQYLLLNLKIGKNRKVDLDSAVISKNNEEAAVKIEDGGKKLTVELKGNPTTGYQWTFIPDDSGVMKLAKDEYIENQHPKDYVGVGGRNVYVFNPAKNRPGNKTTLRFEYGRSWIKGFAWARLFDVTVDKDGVVQSITFRYEEGDEDKEEAKLEKAAADLKNAADEKKPEKNAKGLKNAAKVAAKKTAASSKADDKGSLPNFLDMVELASDEVLVIRVPEDWEYHITTPAVLDTLAEGERSNGILSVSFLPKKDGLGKNDEVASVTAYGDEGSMMVDLKVTPKGKISLDGLTYQVIIDEDTDFKASVDGNKKQLKIEIAGSEKKDDIWVAVPDNSGVLKIEEQEPVSIDGGSKANIATLYVWTIKGEKKPLGNEGSVIFKNEKGQGFKLNIVLNKNGVIEKVTGEEV